MLGYLAEGFCWNVFYELLTPTYGKNHLQLELQVAPRWIARCKGYCGRIGIICFSFGSCRRGCGNVRILRLYSVHFLA